MGSERLGVTAKMDLVEVRTRKASGGAGEAGDLFAGREALEVCPVDYKVSYRRALELQARLLAKALTAEIPEYVPLTTR